MSETNRSPWKRRELPRGVSAGRLIGALENPGYVRERVALTLAERERMARALQAHPTWRALPSHANFLLIRTPDAAAAHAALLARGVLVRRQDSLHGLQGCIRVTVGPPDENSAFLRAAGLDR